MFHCSKEIHEMDFTVTRKHPNMASHPKRMKPTARSAFIWKECAFIAVGRLNPRPFSICRLLKPRRSNHNARMKILIQDIKTRYYLTNDGHWTANPRDAEDFLGSGRAWYFAKLTMAGDFRVLAYFPNSQSSVTVKEQLGAIEGTGMLLAA
jgi:hypothetical protein